MHDTAFEIGRKFFDIYCRGRKNVRILEIGSLDVNGTLRDCAPRRSKYTGADIAPGPGVDVVLEDPNFLPFKDNRFDVAVASSCFEHAQMFWLSFLEMVRVTKPGGYVYLNTPSNGFYHSYPFDNWRFYPDSGLALVAWAAHEGRPVSLVESFIAGRKADHWNDCVIVFRKGQIRPQTLPKRRLARAVEPIFNLRSYDSDRVENLVAESEDQQLVSRAKQDILNSEDEAHKTRLALEEVRGNLAAASNTFAQQVVNLAATIESQKTDLESVTAQLAVTDTQLRKREAQIAQLTGEAAQFKELLHKEQSLRQERETDIVRVTRELDSTRLYLRDCQAEVQRLAGECDEANTVAAKLTAQLQSEQARARKAEVDIERLSRESAADAVAEYQARLAALDENIAARNSRIEQLEARLSVEKRDRQRVEANEAEAKKTIREIENRVIDLEATLAKSQIVDPAPLWKRAWSRRRQRRLTQQLITSELFDPEWYVREYPETAKNNCLPVEHYLAEGYLRGYRPNPFFDSRWYLQRYEDVRKTGINPLVHYMLSGYREGRDPGPEFETEFYLVSNPDVRTNGMNPLTHYLRYGRHEGRSPKRSL